MCDITNRAGPASGTDCRGPSGSRWLRACCSADRGNAEAGSRDSPLGAAGLCGVPRVRISRSGAPPAFASCTRARCRHIPQPLETASRSPDHRAGLFGTAVDDGQASWSRPKIRCRCVDRRSGGIDGNRAAVDDSRGTALARNHQMSAAPRTPSRIALAGPPHQRGPGPASQELTTATASISIMKSGPARRVTPTVVLVGVATPR